MGRKAAPQLITVVVVPGHQVHRHRKRGQQVDQMGAFISTTEVSEVSSQDHRVGDRPGCLPGLPAAPDCRGGHRPSAPPALRLEAGAAHDRPRTCAPICTMRPACMTAMRSVARPVTAHGAGRPPRGPLRLEPAPHVPLRLDRERPVVADAAGNPEPVDAGPHGQAELLRKSCRTCGGHFQCAGRALKWA
jgi:hypothetical protein